MTFALWETFRPRKALVVPAPRRWANHAVLWLMSIFSANWIYRVSAVVVASAVASSRYGLLNREAVPLPIRCVAAVLLLDLFRYGQHCLFHAVPFLWRVHRVHHADPDYDWSTGLRFHPLEVLLSQGSYLAVIAAVAPPPVAVFGLELADVAVNLFVHANVSLPGPIDAYARLFLITPDMHRIHHSGEFSEQNTNFGVVFPWWDRLFRTYLPQPAAGQDKMVIGLPGFSAESRVNLLGMLALPFRR